MDEQKQPSAIRIFVDADACPVKNEAYRVAERYGLKVFVVANSFMNVPRSDLIERVIVPEGPDVADGWIADRVTELDIVITADIPLASRCVKNGAYVLSPTGKVFDNDSIGMALATRDLLTDLRSAGATTRGPPAPEPPGYLALSVGARFDGGEAEAKNRRLKIRSSPRPAYTRFASYGAFGVRRSAEAEGGDPGAAASGSGFRPTRE